MWYKVSEKTPEMGVEIIGYNQDWVDEDFNPNGTRVCFYDDTGWYSAKWSNDQDSYSTVGCMRSGCSEDNCEFSNSCKSKNGPTHWIPMPKMENVEIIEPGRETDKLTKMAKTVYEITDEYSEKNELHCLVLMSDKIGGASFTIGSESAIVKEFKELAKRHDAFKNILNKLKQL